MSLFYHTITISLIIILAPLLSSAADTSSPPSGAPSSQSSVCSSTPDPKYCRSVLPNDTSSNNNVFTYGHFSIRKSLSQSRKFLSLVDKLLRNDNKNQNKNNKNKNNKPNNPVLATPARRALEDCRLLAGLTMDFLLGAFEAVNATSASGSALPRAEADDVATLLSAAITNEQTCRDGLQSAAATWTLRNGLAVPLANDTKLYSVSLALFTRAWVPRKKRGVTWQSRKSSFRFRNGRLPLKMTERSRGVLRSLNGRTLLQDVDEEVLVSDIVVVSQDGSGNFTTIGEAVAAAPNNTKEADGYFLIYVSAGVYEEYVSVAKNKKYLMMVGDGINQTVITGNRSVVDGWTTFNSATLAVMAPNFVAVNITIRNTAGAIKHQAVALRNSADLSTFYSCSFEAYQDTLYTHSLRQFYRECDIYGTVDFIFGNAAVVLQSCNIYPRLPMTGQFNAITAQGRTDPNQVTGISIHNCTIRAADDLASTNRTVQTYLGRPWKEYSRTVVMQSSIGAVVNAAGWRAWDGEFALATLYYAEYNNTGTGSNTTGRVTWPGYHVIDNVTDAANFTVANFLFGDLWIPITGVPYASGLLN